MESTRQQKYARLVQKEMADIFQSEMGHTFGKVMITVTQVRVSPDLGVAKIYISLFPVEDKKALLEKIKEQSWDIRHRLGQRIRKQARIVPELMFFLDDSLDYAERINELLKNNP
jgi:ribosome-binding factor A